MKIVLPNPVKGMNRNVLCLVAAFVNERRVREWLGFPFERCLHLRIPPCTVAVADPFKHRLKVLLEAKTQTKPLVVYDAESKIAVSIKFWWRFGRLTFKVRRCHEHTFTIQRTYYTYIYTGEHSMVNHDAYAQWPAYTIQ